MYSIGIGICTALLIWIIAHLNVRFPKLFAEPASYVILDSFTTILSFAATILMIRKKVECWILRIIVDIIGIYLYYVKGVQFIALEYVLFLCLAINGLLQRQKNAKKTSDLSTL
ncbi:nicotinamide mononucleotide transporter [Patescibacteria group bacterium]|nr:nicotinamide mononucleotide transporter [Patescibacteria group bacterium]